MERGLPLGRLYNIQLSLDWSWVSLSVVALPVAMLALQSQALDPWAFEVIVGVSLGVLVSGFGSVLFHLTAHVLMANLEGVAVQRAVLYPFGETTDAALDPDSPSVDAKVALAGPLGSAVLASLLLIALAAVKASGVLTLFEDTQGEPLHVLMGWAAAFNLFLVLVNLVPAAPLDMGFVVRALVWRHFGNFLTAQRVVRVLGVVFGWVLLLGALYVAAFTDLDPVARVPLALCLVLLGWSVKTAASHRLPDMRQDPFVDARIGDLPLAQPSIVSPHLTVQQLVSNHILGTTESSFVILRGDTLEGMLWLDDVWKIPEEQWKRVLVRHVMTPPERMVILKPGESAVNLPERLTRRHNRSFPVVENWRFVGLVERGNVDEWLARQEQQGKRDAPIGRLSHSLRQYLS